MSVFNAMDAILSSRQRGSVAQKLDLVFHDMDLIPLMYQENYLNFANEKNGPDSVESMAFASNAISAGWKRWWDATVSKRERIEEGATLRR